MQLLEVMKVVIFGTRSILITGNASKLLLKLMTILLRLTIDNYGSKPVELGFAVTGKVKVTGTNINLELDQAGATKVTIMLPAGTTNLTVSGNGTVHFQFKREEMI